MSGELLEGLALGWLVGWTFRGLYESAWDRWVKPRLMRWFLKGITEP